jgi:AcrR family transcriptional regulator
MKANSYFCLQYWLVSIEPYTERQSISMKYLDDEKRAKILNAAAELFATQPFHKVLLSDVAEAAGVGKGTLYIYFKSKEDLYVSVLYSGFSAVLDHLREQLNDEIQDPVEKLKVVIRETVAFAFHNPYLFEVMRTMPGREAIDRAQWDAKRMEYKLLVESVIREGIAQKIFDDPYPELTARYIPGLVRSALLDGVETVDQEILAEHMVRLVGSAIIVKEERS